MAEQIARVPGWPVKKPTTLLHACGACGGLSIQFEWWLDVNRDRVMDSCQSDAYWCPRCQDHHRWCLTLQRIGDSQLWRCDDEQGAEGQLRRVLRALCPERPRWPADSKRAPEAA